MKKLILTICLFFNATSFLYSQTDPLFWEIRSKDNAKTSYLIGIPYVLCPKDLIFTEIEKQKLLKSDQIYIQNDITRPTFITEVLSANKLPDNVRLKDYYSTKDYAYLKSFFKDSINVDLDEDRFNFAPIVLYNMVIAQMIGCEPQSAETQIIRLALDNNKKICEFEKSTEIYEHLNKIELETRTSLLLQFVKNYRQVRQTYTQMKRDYYRPERIQIETLLKSSLPLKEPYSFPQQSRTEYLSKFTSTLSDLHYKFLVEERALNWATKMQRALEDKPTFFIVPEYILSGNQGLLVHLSKMGYELKPFENIFKNNVNVQNPKKTDNSYN
ncbi:TraB/GumN family protein [Solitalea lacus]|uniref:TraB/GumN family protein n=1 Tax=Solitalea lacus TaxID=2911172 RepID=UPI001EDAE3F1|nr:TraB/GumN family protein [Solitalea lacus]UKJ09270.1 TraB/GumN family protein [Solitalea lacus]